MSHASSRAPSVNVDKEFDALSKYLPSFWNISQSQAAYLVSKVYSHVAEKRPHTFYTQPIIDLLSETKDIRRRRLRAYYPRSVSDEFLNTQDSVLHQLGLLLGNVDTFYASTMSQLVKKSSISGERSEYIQFLEAGESIEWFYLLEQRSTVDSDFFKQSGARKPAFKYSYQGEHYLAHSLSDLQHTVGLFESLVSQRAHSLATKHLSDRQLLVHCLYDYCISIVSYINTAEMQMDMMRSLNVETDDTLYFQAHFDFAHPLLKVFDEQSFAFDLLFRGLLDSRHIDMLEKFYGTGFFDSFREISADFTKNMPERADTPFHRQYRLALTEHGLCKALSALEKGQSSSISELFDTLKFKRIHEQEVVAE